jgi:hypothetical protein
MVWRLVEGLLGPGSADELGFTDLGGSGSASRLTTMVSSFTTYAQRTVIIVDSEGAMKEYVTGLIRSHELPAEDVLLFKANLEDSNFLPVEMLDVLIERAANPPDKRPAVTLDLPIDDVLAAHQERTQSAREEPGLAGILLKLAEDPSTADRSRSQSRTSDGIGRPDAAGVLRRARRRPCPPGSAVQSAAAGLCARPGVAGAHGSTLEIAKKRGEGQTRPWTLASSTHGRPRPRHGRTPAGTLSAWQTSFQRGTHPHR